MAVAPGHIDQNAQYPDHLAMENNLSSSDYMRRWEAAKYLRISPRTMARWIERAQIPYVRVGRLTLFRKSALDRAMDKLTVRSYGDVREEQERIRRSRW